MFVYNALRHTVVQSSMNEKLPHIITAEYYYKTHQNKKLRMKNNGRNEKQKY